MFKRVGINEQIVAGWLAGAVARTLTNPFGALLTLMDMMNEEGMASWFKGSLINIFKQIPYDVIYAVSNEYMKEWLTNSGLSSESLELVSAIESSAVANVLTHPLETIRTRLVVQEDKGKNKKYEGITDTLNTIITEEGYWALFKGVEATILSVIPFELGMHFGRKFVNWLIADDTWKFLKFSLTTAMAKTIAYPFELVSRKMQAQSPTIPTDNKPDVHFTGMLDCFQEIVNKHGVTGLWTGNVVNLLKIVPFHLLIYGLYTLIKPTLSDLKRELHERQILY